MQGNYVTLLSWPVCFDELIEPWWHIDAPWCLGKIIFSPSCKLQYPYLRSPFFLNIPLSTIMQLLYRIGWYESNSFLQKKRHNNGIPPQCCYESKHYKVMESMKTNLHNGRKLIFLMWFSVSTTCSTLRESDEGKEPL